MTGAGSSGAKIIRCAAVLLLFGASAACSLLPEAGPTKSELQSSLDDTSLGYTLINVDQNVAAILHNYPGGTFGARFKNSRYRPSDALHPGDVISITIFEIGQPGVVAAPGTTPPAQQSGSFAGTTTVVPPQVVESDGTIMLPFVGRIKASGKNPAQLGAEIQKDLQGKAVEPQVVVTPVTSVTNVATVDGDVNGPRPVPLTLRGERILDVIAAAGGTKHPPYDEYVTVVRKGHVESVLLQTIVVHSTENIVVRPNDQIYVTYYPRTFAVLGATTKVSQYTFDTARVTLAEAVARAGGPVDTIGDPSGVYLFRYEPASIASMVLGKDVATATVDGPNVEPNKERGFVPILYRVDFRTAAGYFLSQNIDMRDKDVVLVTNAEATQLQKLLTGVRGFTGIAYDLSRQAGG